TAPRPPNASEAKFLRAQPWSSGSTRERHTTYTIDWQSYLDEMRSSLLLIFLALYRGCITVLLEQGNCVRLRRRRRRPHPSVNVCYFGVRQHFGRIRRHIFARLAELIDKDSERHHCGRKCWSPALRIPAMAFPTAVLHVKRFTVLGISSGSVLSGVILGL